MPHMESKHAVKAGPGLNKARHANTMFMGAALRVANDKQLSTWVSPTKTHDRLLLILPELDLSVP